MSERQPHIGCGACQDLIPLVQDGVASTESRQLVAGHTAQCPQCRALLAAGSSSVPPVAPAPELLTVRRLRRQLLTGALLILLVGVLGGSLLTYSIDMFYNLLIMPAIGAAGYLVLRRQWYWSVAGAGLCSLVGVLCKLLLFDHSGPVAALIAAVPMAVLYAAPAAVGCLIGFLLHFAFKKEDTP